MYIRIYLERKWSKLSDHSNKIFSYILKYIVMFTQRINFLIDNNNKGLHRIDRILE